MEITVLTPWRRHNPAEPRKRLRVPPKALLFVWSLTAIWAVIVAWGLLNRMRAGQTVVIPAAIQGVWQTRAHNFEGRALEITPTAIVFRSSADSGISYPVVRLHSNVQRDDGLTGWYSVSYGSRRQPHQIDIFYYHSTRRPRIWTRNRQDVIWMR